MLLGGQQLSRLRLRLARGRLAVIAPCRRVVTSDGSTATLQAAFSAAPLADAMASPWQRLQPFNMLCVFTLQPIGPYSA